MALQEAGEAVIVIEEMHHWSLQDSSPLEEFAEIVGALAQSTRR